MKRTTQNLIVSSERTLRARIHRLRVRLARIAQASRAIDPYFIPVIAVIAIAVIWSAK